MHTEGQDYFDTLGRKVQQPYVSGNTPHNTDDEKTGRENDRLKKSLEKEQFFNRLLDQEIRELKNTLEKYEADGALGNLRKRGTGVSRGAFYTLLLLTLGMAGFLGYTLYFNKQYHLFSANDSVSSVAPAANDMEGPTPNAVTPELNTTTNEQPRSANAAGIPDPIIKDSVPNIIGNQSVTATNPVHSETPRTITTPPNNNINNNTTTRQAVPPAIPEKPKVKTEVPPVVSTPSAASAKVQPKPLVEQAAPVVPPASRPVIGKYKVTSKANFYGSADENTLRSSFISQSPAKMVNALEEKNGFIYVEYTNEMGLTTKGWLSKKDLTKAE